MWILLFLSGAASVFAADSKPSNFKSLALDVSDSATPSSDMGTPRSITTAGSATPSAFDEDAQADAKGAREKQLIAVIHESFEDYNRLLKKCLDLHCEDADLETCQKYDEQIRKTRCFTPYPAQQKWRILFKSNVDIDERLAVLASWRCYPPHFAPLKKDNAGEILVDVCTAIELPQDLKKIRDQIRQDPNTLSIEVLPKVRFKLDS